MSKLLDLENVRIGISNYLKVLENKLLTTDKRTEEYKNLNLRIRVYKNHREEIDKEIGSITNNIKAESYG